MHHLKMVILHHVANHHLWSSTSYKTIYHQRNHLRYSQCLPIPLDYFFRYIYNMNHETYIKEVQHFKTLLELDKLIQEEHIAKRENLKHLLHGYIFYPISTWPSSIREIVEHDTITSKNTFQMILFPYGHGISQDVLIEYLYTLFLNTPSKTRKRIHQLMWIMTNINMHQHKW